MRKVLCGAAAALGVALVCVCVYTLNAQNYTPANTAPRAAGPADGVSALIAPPASPVQSGGAPETSSETRGVSSDASTQGARPVSADAASAPETPPASDAAGLPPVDVEVMGETTPRPDSILQSTSDSSAPQSTPDSGSASASGSGAPDSAASSQNPADSAASQKPESGSQSAPSGPDSAPQDSSSPSEGQEKDPPARSMKNPLTGLPLAAPIETRPVAVMIDNVQAALPQRGLQSADVVYESVTEGGVTRLAAIYADASAMPATGPVCAARDQFVQLLLPMNAACVHVGSSDYARALWAQYPHAAALDGATQPALLMLDSTRRASMSIEYCWFTDGTLAAAPSDGGQETPPMFSFAPEARTLAGGEAWEVYVRFSSYANSTFSYDAARGVYVKAQFGAPHMDENTGEALTFDNLLILFANESRYPDGALTLVDFAAGGEGRYICGGHYEVIHWSKATPGAPLTLTAADGTPLAINCGRTYMATVGSEMAELFQISAAPEAPQDPASSEPQAPSEPDSGADSTAPDTPPAASDSAGNASSAGSAPASSSEAQSGADSAASSGSGSVPPQSAGDASAPAQPDTPPPDGAS